MRRGQRPDFTLLRPPPNGYVTKAQQWFMDQLLDLEPGAEDVDGGRYAHKPGYHDTVAHNDARSGVGADYSARDPEDRRGPRDKTRAWDWTFRDAQAGNFADFAKYGDRLLAAYRANDPRLAGWREYLGRVSTPVTINGRSTRRVGIDFRKRSLRIPDSSHDWHGHGSEDTEQVESYWNKWALLTILAGWSLAEWKQSTTATQEDDMADYAAQLNRIEKMLTNPDGRETVGMLYKRMTVGKDDRPDAVAVTHPTLASIGAGVTALAAEVAALRSVVSGLAKTIQTGGGSVDTAAILAGVDKAVNAAVATMTAETRDAVADLGEGGAEQVRADA